MPEFSNSTAAPLVPFLKDRKKQTLGEAGFSKIPFRVDHLVWLHACAIDKNYSMVSDLVRSEADTWAFRKSVFIGTAEATTTRPSAKYNLNVATIYSDATAAWDSITLHSDFVGSTRSLCVVYDEAWSGADFFGELGGVDKIYDLRIETPAGMGEESVAAALAEINEYRQLEDGWDGVGSVKPNAGAIADALKFFCALPAGTSCPEPTVSADGSVGWYWKTPGKFISIGFDGDGRYSYYGSVNGSVARGSYELSNKNMIPQDLLSILHFA